MLAPEGRGCIKLGALGDGLQCPFDPGTPHFFIAQNALNFPTQEVSAVFLVLYSQIACLFRLAELNLAH